MFASKLIFVSIYVAVLTPFTIAGVNISQYEKVLIDSDPAKREEMMTRTGRRTVPQIYVGDFHVGGFDDLSALDKSGKLDPLLEINK